MIHQFCMNHRRNRWIQTVIFGLLMCCYSPWMAAQSTYGSLTGAVADSSGAVIPGATVTLTNTGTGQKLSQVTGDTGLYTFVNLLPGDYNLLVTRQGFQQTGRENISIQVQQAVRLDIALSVGAATQTVQVSSAAPLLQPDSSSLGQVVEQRAANELPLNGRNIFSLVEVSPSVVMQGGAGTSPTGQNPFSWTNFQIGGGFANQNAQYLDGQPLNSGYINLAVLIPTQDSIGEFKVQTHNLGPEWGKLAGGVLNLSTKSGTNTWHGELYEYLRNRALDANTWFSDYHGLAKPAFTQNQFGGNVGGPILKDKAFFFFSYEGFRLRQGQTFTTTVPTAAERTGDLSQLESAVNGANQQIIDPCNGAATCTTRTPAPFAGNIIPAGRINPTAKALLALWPMPNLPGVLNNYSVNASTGGNQNQYVARVDENINDKQHVFARFNWWNDLNLPVDPLGTGICAGLCTETISSRDLALGYNYIFNANTVGNINVSMSRFLYNRTPKNAGFDYMTIGWPSSFNSQVGAEFRTPPTPVVNGMASDIMGTQGQGWIQDHNTMMTLSPSITLIRGRHTIQMGGMLQIQLDNYGQTNGAGGIFHDSGAYTGLPFADFLLGWADNSSSAALPGQPAGKQNYYALYFNDDVHATSKLTLNLGLRYDIQEPWTERYNRLSYWDPTAINMLATSAMNQTVLGAVGLVDSPGVHSSRYNMNSNKAGFGPRIGFGYSLDANTAIRGGYGLFWVPIDSAYNITPQYDPVGYITTQYTGNVTSNTPTNTISTPWPVFLQPPGRSPNYAADLQGQSLTAVTPQFKYGYMQQWNLSLQRQLPGGYVAEVAYAASKGTALPPNQGGLQSNQLSDNYFAQAAQQAASGQPVSITQSVSNPFQGVSSPGTSLAQPTVLAGQLLRPFPDFSNISIVGKPGFNSSYNALEATLQKHFHRGGMLIAAYTWSKLMSNTDTSTYWLESGGIGAVQDATNLHNEWSLSSQNVSQHLIVSYVLDLPFGRGQMYLANLNDVTEKVISGWGIDGITTFQAGFPIAINDALNTTMGQFGAGLRPEVVAGCAKATHGSAVQRVESGLNGGNGWINSSCFAQPTAWTFGNEPRVDASLRSQGIDNFDFALFKNTNFGPSERMGVQFRSEFYNIFNRTQFGNPGNYFGSSGFGWVTSQANNPRLVQFALKFMF